MNTDNHDDALFKVAVIKNFHDGDPLVKTFTVTQLANKIAQPRIAQREYGAYHHHKAEQKRLTKESREAKLAGDMSAAKALKAEAAHYENLQQEIKNGPALMPYHYKNDIGYKKNAEGKRRRENDRITHWSLLQLDVESQISTDEIHQVLAPFEYLLWPTISHRPDDPRYRVILFLATPVVPQTAADIILRIDALLPARNDITKKTQAIDPASTDLQGRLMYFPTWLAKHPEQYKSIHNHGRLVTPDDFALTPEQQAAVTDRTARSNEAKQERVKTHQTIVKAQGIDGTVIERKGKFYLNPNGYVESDQGWIRVRDVTKKIPNISCPVHGDTNGSEFIDYSVKSDNVRLYCKHCGNIWADKQRPENDDSANFAKLLAKLPDSTTPTTIGSKAPSKQPIFEVEEHSYIEVNERYLDPQIMNMVEDTGITLIKSPKGTGKTEVLKPFVTKCRKENRSVLLIGHRVNLLRELSERLDLDYYLDLPENGTSEHMAICMDSVTRISKDDKHPPDTIIIDESEQVFSHMISDTMKGKRAEIFNTFVWALRNAKRVILLDADLTSEMTLDLIKMLRGSRVKDEPFVGIKNLYVFERRTTVMYEDRYHILADAIQAVVDGGKIFLSTNYRSTGADVFARVFETMGKKVLLVSSETTQTNPDVVSFMENTSEESKKYDVVVCTPTVQTGVSIDNDHFTHVFGVFYKGVGTFQDIDQALSRVRRLNTHHVWVEPVNHKVPAKTEREIYEEALNKEREGKYLIYSEEEQVRISKGEMLWADVYSRIVHLQEEWSRFKLEQFVQLRVENGYTIQHELKDFQLSAVGKEIYQLAESMKTDGLALELWNALELDGEDFEILEKKRNRSHTEYLQVERYRYKKVLDSRGLWNQENLTTAVSQDLLRWSRRLDQLVNWTFSNQINFDIASRKANDSILTDNTNLTMRNGLFDLLLDSIDLPARKLVALAQAAAEGQATDIEITKEQLQTMAKVFQENQRDFKRYLNCRITDPTDDKNLKKVWTGTVGKVLPIKTRKLGPKGEQKIHYYVDWEAKNIVLQTFVIK